MTWKPTNDSGPGLATVEAPAPKEPWATDRGADGGADRASGTRPTPAGLAAAGMEMMGRVVSEREGFLQDVQQLHGE